MQRNYGVDIARIMAMFMVVVVHNFNKGGVLNNTTSTLGFLSAYELFNISIVAVNIFAIITGYLYSGKGIKIQRIVSLYFEVWFLSIFSLVVYSLIFGLPKNIDIVKSFFPLLGGVYWYFNAYIGFVVIEPVLRYGLKHIGKTALLRVIVVILIFAGTVGFINKTAFQFGYSTEWLVTLFLVGVLIKKYHVELETVKTKLLLIIALIGSVATLPFDYFFQGQNGHFSNYTSPIIIIQSIVVFVLITRIKVKNPIFQKVLIMVSSLSFGVYLLDSSVVFYGYILKDLFKNITQNYTIGITLIIVVGCSIVFFTAFIAINYVREKIFKVLMINQLIINIARVLEGVISRIKI